MPRTCSHIHCCTVVSLSQPSRTERTHRPRSSPRCTTSPGDVGSGRPASRWSLTRWKARCHSTGQAGHQAGSMSSSCSRRPSDSAPADDRTGGLGTPLLDLGRPAGGGPRVLQEDAHLRALEGGVQRGQEVAGLGRPAARGREAFLPGDVEVRPDHAQLLQLLDAVGVHVTAGVGPAVVGDPLPERERGERGRPPLGLNRLVVAAGHPVGEGHLQIAAGTGVEGGGLDAAPPVRVLGVEDTQVDERGQLRRVARHG